MNTLWRGTLPYTQALEEQRSQRAQVIAGDAPEALWFLEHPPTITTGRRPVPDLPTAEVLARRSITLVPTERGGLATAHNPGQLVVYLFVDAHRRGGVRELVCTLQKAVESWLLALGIEAGSRPGAPGVWVGTEKVAALGLHIARGHTMHGLALNLTNDLGIFDLITPCGITDGGVTRVANLIEVAPSPQEAAQSLAPVLIRAIGP